MTDDLSTLLHDAVADVEPADRLDEIRARTASPMRSAARPWFYAVGATVLATAATVAAFAVLDRDDGGDAGPSHHGHDQQTQLVAAYYVGDTPMGPRLYREYDEVPAGDPLQAALDRIEQPASDPDYRTSWTPDSFGDVTVDEDGIDVELGVNDLSDDLAVQQVAYTLQAAAGERLPVWFWLDGQRGNRPYDAEPENDVLNLVSISDPAEGNEYEGSFTARGRANSNEGTVVWEIRQGDRVVKSSSTTAEGSVDRLYRWEAEIDLTGVAPGTYTFVAMTDDPSDGEGPGPFTDTRTIVVR
ncbi:MULTISPECIES: Gmad2 immunoglobulin-like domain-containing protein [unclassified Nocardioides]|uniref:Gmad2 immunoglobulin-like domain-containing protein n=1 Tax=unclassified Nocardioides TaxID=2615069 RepID=UPI000A26D3FA|nr:MULTISPECIES: Gmad2 immunoglobulin-like domain-containing protein [unclassified Nocardioides]